jgi:membrane protease YdiL (CAAX protease family)
MRRAKAEVTAPDAFPAIDTPIPQLDVVSPFDALLHYAPIKALVPIPVILAVAPLVWLMFRGTWKELDEEARERAAVQTETDYRPLVALVLLGVTLTVQDYYGGRNFFQSTVEPFLASLEDSGQDWIQLRTYRSLWGQCWWAAARVVGYLFVPLLVWKILYRDDSVLDMGLRVKGFMSHLWIYGLCLLVVIVAMAILQNQRDFLDYYPFYKGASRSWFDLLVWESAYFLQFFALEFYFRGWLLAALRRSMGSVAIFVMAVPYCMIHYGKPYLEAHGAIIAGIVLGSLAMRTKSIYAGFLVHITVAGIMDYMALASRNGIPTRFWPD